MSTNNNVCSSFDEYTACEVKKASDGLEWPAGDGILHIYDDYKPLFTSATWSVTAKLNGKIITNTIPIDKPHDQRFINKWAQYLIRNRKKWLRDLGVDVFSEYVKWGGRVEDLND